MLPREALSRKVLLTSSQQALPTPHLVAEDRRGWDILNLGKKQLTKLTNWLWGFGGLGFRNFFFHGIAKNIPCHKVICRVSSFKVHAVFLFLYSYCSVPSVQDNFQIVFFVVVVVVVVVFCCCYCLLL